MSHATQLKTCARSSNMRNDRNKYILLIAIFGILIYLACQFYLSQGNAIIFTFLPSDSITQGVALIIVIGIVSSALYYYRTMREKWTVKGALLGAELNAYTFIANDIKKHTHIAIVGSIDEIHQLRNSKNIYLNLDRFNTPIETGNHIRLSTGNDNYSPFIDCMVASIDSLNKTVELVTIVE